MLEELSVRNFALIDSLSLRFTRGLNILSGETGAGKSIVIGAVGLLFGEKGDTSTIRTGTEEAEVVGVIGVSGSAEAAGWLEEHQIEPEDGVVIIRRILKKNGRGSIFIQSTPATRKDIQELTSLVFDLHGQHEHQSLLNIDQHRKMLDRFGDTEGMATALSRKFSDLQEKKQVLESLVKSEMELLRERDILSYAVEEITAANLVPGEEEELETEKGILLQGEKLFSLLDRTRDFLSEGKGGALGLLSEARHSLNEICRIDSSLAEHGKRVEAAYYEIEDVVDVLRTYHQTVDFSPQRLEKCEERLQEIHRLEKKYGNTIEAVRVYVQEAELKIRGMEDQEQKKEALEAEIKDLERQVLGEARELSKRRKSSAGRLEGLIQEKLRILGMPKAVFSISVSNREVNGKASCGPYGFDRVEFLISPNEGEPLKPLKDIASGGEISRIMLSIKTILAESDHILSMIFDEIDSGIGGEVALAVGEHLAKIADSKQVLCITHLASIAVRADNHLKVVKEERKGRTNTAVLAVEKNDRVVEIARMLSGDPVGEASLSHARDLLSKYGR